MDSSEVKFLRLKLFKIGLIIELKASSHRVKLIFCFVAMNEPKV